MEPDLRAGAPHHPDARADLGDLLRSTGRLEEARAVFEEGVRLGEVESMLPLGNLYADYLEVDELAEATYRQGIEAVDVHCHHNLAVLLDRRGDTHAAEMHYRLGADAGDALALRGLNELRAGFDLMPGAACRVDDFVTWLRLHGTRRATKHSGLSGMLDSPDPLNPGMFSPANMQ